MDLRLLLCAAAALYLGIPSTTSAHGGGLDAHGCHHNRKAGGYHCHRGPLAGQHFASKQEMLQRLQQGPTSRPERADKKERESRRPQ